MAAEKPPERRKTMKLEKIMIELLKRNMKGVKDELVDLETQGYAIKTNNAIYVIEKERFALDAEKFEKGSMEHKSIYVPETAVEVKRINTFQKLTVGGKAAYVESLVGNLTETCADEKLLNIFEVGKNGTKIFYEGNSGLIFVEECEKVTGIILPLEH